MTVEAALLTADNRHELKQWLGANRANLPEHAQLVIERFLSLLDALEQSKHRLSKCLDTIRREMGITPKSERRGARLGTKDSDRAPARRRRRTQREILEDERDQLEQRSSRLRQKNSSVRKSLRRVNRELDRLTVEEEDRAMSSETQTDAESEAELRQGVEELMARLTAGDGEVDPELTRSKEAIIHSAIVTNAESIDEPVVPDPSQYDPAEVKDTIVEQRVRYDFTLAIERRVFNVEKKVVVEPDGTRKIINPSTACYGPPKFSVTWGFLVNVTIMVASGAMPMNRLARFISTADKEFKSGTLYKMMHYVARRFAPVYVHLFDAMANADVLSGDDSPAKVLQVAKHFRSGGTDTDAPWRDWGQPNSQSPASSEGARQRPPLSDQFAREFGLVFDRRSGKGKKQTFHTSVLSGRSVADDPRSEITFYRSHLGGLGNLLEALLRRRDPEFERVAMQCDLSTVNLVADPELLETFDVTIFGCGAHARRPFNRYFHDDPQLCELMLDLFGELSHYERSLDIAGRNKHNVSAVRDVDARDSWEEILGLAKLIECQWSGQTNLGDAAKYIIRNYEALTRYLDDPRMSWSNNHSERDLRAEKMIESSSMFRVSLEGRCVLDVMRTICQTASAATVPLAEYLEFVLRSAPEDIEKSPADYTPYAWALAHQGDWGDVDDGEDAEDGDSGEDGNAYEVEIHHKDDDLDESGYLEDDVVE